jgi:hypothetical protein
LNYARGVAVQYLEQRFSTVHVPDQSGDAHAPVIGKINWQLQNIVISGLSLPQSSISILPGRGVSVNMYAVSSALQQRAMETNSWLCDSEQASLEITMDFHYREHHWYALRTIAHARFDSEGVRTVLFNQCIDCSPAHPHRLCPGRTSRVTAVW